MQNIKQTSNQLHIFSKNTDAVATIRGFEYQKLKTMVLWLESFNKPEDCVYCEYEDDIMQADLEHDVLIFRQIKLYTTSFSLGSEEVKKAIANFFMLYCKPSYLQSSPLFSFETNSYAGSTDTLLSKWITQQGNLSNGLLKQCKEAIYEILEEYIESEARAAIDRAQNKINRREAKLSPHINKKISIKIEKEIELLRREIDEIEHISKEFKTLDEKIFLNFTQLIRWEFLNITPEEAIESTVKEIDQKILQLPQQINKSEIPAIRGRLHWEISQRSGIDIAEERCLTYRLLESILLNRKEGQDQWYFETREKWFNTSIEECTYAEFYEVVSGSHYCRQTEYLQSDLDNWLNIFQQYYLADFTPIFLKRKAVYEICMLAMGLNPISHLPSGTLNNGEDHIKAYFEDLEGYKTMDDISDATVLLSMVRWEITFSDSLISQAEYDLWENRLRSFINERLTTGGSNYKCEMLECKAHFILLNDIVVDLEKACRDALICLNELIDTLPKAPLYTVYSLNELLNAQLNLLINRISEELIDEFENINDQLNNWVKEREGNEKGAERYIDQGKNYFASEKIIRAINSYHKAKDLSWQGETRGNFAIICLNLAQFYAYINMNFAAKKYAMAAATIVNTNKSELLKYYPRAWSIISFIDYSQGAWIHFLNSYENYILTTVELNTDELKLWQDPESPSVLNKLMITTATIHYVVQSLAIEFKYFTDYKLRCNRVLQEEYDKIFEILSKKLSNKIEKELIKFLSKQIDDIPFSDVGPKRVIQWMALGSKWIIHFQNDWIGNAIGEQFASVLQILQVEMTSEDLHLIQGNIEVELAVNIENKEINYSSEKSEKRIFWNITVPSIVTIDFNDKEELKSHQGQIVFLAFMLLCDISLLPREEKILIWEKHLRDNALMDKIMSVQTYEKLYKDLITQEDFQEANRHAYTSPFLRKDFITPENKELKWRDGISKKYDEKQAIEHINYRYKYLFKTMQRTVSILKNNEQVQAILKLFKEKGYLDWHILWAIKNILTNYKVNKIIQEEYSWASGDEYVEIFNKIFSEVKYETEETRYIPIPIELFEFKEIQFWLEMLPLKSLDSFGLENDSENPMLNSIHDFLIKRFRFGLDDVEHDSVVK